jgi:hypothetical protein
VVEIDGTILHLPGGTECQISREVDQLLTDDISTWGSFGGQWSDLGLLSTGGSYPVQIFDLSCSSPDLTRLIFQAESDRRLLDVSGHVFVPLVRLPGA